MRRHVQLIAAAAAVLALGGCGSSSSSSSSTATTQAATQTSTTSSAAQMGFEGVRIEAGAVLASPSTTGNSTVDGITCGATEQLAYHIHAHLQVYVNGQSRAVPGGIGIPGSKVVPSSEGPVAAGGSCIYWLHTHAPDGVIHIESPTKHIFTLGNLFDIWHQPLSANQIGSASGKLTVFVNGQPWSKDPRSVPLKSHTTIQISVGSPVVPFHALNWAGTQL